MFKMIAGYSGGDCTCAYNIELDKDYTVKEFIETVLSEKDCEWGYFGIHSANYFSEGPFGYPHCEYKSGKLLYALPEEYLNKKIVSATGSGGWSRMDYLFSVE